MAAVRNVFAQTTRRVGRSVARPGSWKQVANRAINSQWALAHSRSFASESKKEDHETHDDFKPKYHAAPSDNKDDLLAMIESHVKTYPIMLYMKGTPNAPQCGFSLKVVRILHAQGVSFDSVNVLDHPEIREAVKEYSQWPTIPQLYVKGEFIGGCDIVSDMHTSGELADLLQEFKSE